MEQSITFPVAFVSCPNLVLLSKGGLWLIIDLCPGHPDGLDLPRFTLFKNDINTAVHQK